MAKRLAAIVIPILVLGLGFPGIALATQSDGDSFDADHISQTNPIWQGLCVGASLDLSKGSQVRCARKVRDAEQKDNSVVDDKPNIGASLCVGASLDLSKASQAKCVRETPPPPGTPSLQNDSGESSTSSHKHTHHKHSQGNIVAATPPPRVQYAALGDSIAAGLGLAGPIDSGEQCGRTVGSYAYEIAHVRGLEVTNFACSGAKMGDLSTRQVVRGPNLPPQLDGAFAGGAPDLITITAGANDVHWQDFLQKCYARTCGTSRDERVAAGFITALEVKTELVLQDIAQRSNGSPPEVILTGYYIPLSERCAQIEPRLTLEEIAWLNARTAELNQALQGAAAQSGFAAFVPIDFTGHDICSDDPWIQVLDDPAPFHPTTEGQHAIARAIL